MRRTLRDETKMGKMGKIKTIELFSGTCSFSKVAKELGMETLTIDNDSRLKPDRCLDVLDIKSLKGFDIIWISPPCEAFSVASIGKNWELGKPKSMKALKSIALLINSIKLISESKARLWYIENPRGMMRTLIDDVFSSYGLIKGRDYKRETISYCQYGDFRQKPTDIWTNDFNWHPRPICKRGSPCHQAAPRGSRLGTQGIKGKELRGIIPTELIKEILSKESEKQ